ncbi:hypothetical protein BD410DRAFT_896005 [Rickenella mellea]|uniref:Uncharacterized protein n=1 Tax=Rickenella mellea TaxID=50990 RepID=A0A4Y7QDM8_9AGAM|nr:hypothetical protein BD410DRAFT_896005 [Rickenella mellea]
MPSLVKTVLRRNSSFAKKEAADAELRDKERAQEAYEDKIKEFDKLQEEANTLRVAHGDRGKEVQKLQEELSKLQADVEAERNEKERAQQLCTGHLEELERLKAEKEEVQSHEGGEAEHLRTSLNNQAKDLSELQDRFKETLALLATSDAEKGRLEQQSKATEEELHRLSKEVDGLREDLENERRTAGQLKRENEAKDGESHALREAHATLQQAHHGLDSNAAALREERTALGRHLEQEQLSKQDLLNAHEIATNSLRELQDQHQELQMHFERGRQESEDSLSLTVKERDELRGSVVSLTSQLHEAGDVEKELRTRLEGRDADILRLQDETKKLQNAFDDKCKEFDEVDAQFEALQGQVQAQQSDVDQLQGVYEDKSKEVTRMQKEFTELQRGVDTEKKDRRRLQNEHNDIIAELAQLREDFVRQKHELQAEQTGRQPLRRAYEDRIKEVSRLRDEVTGLQRQLGEKKRRQYGPFDEGKEADRLRHERTRIKRRLESEQEEHQRLKRAYEDTREEVRRLRRESGTFLKQSDTCQAEEIVAVLCDLNAKISYLANAVSDQWDCAEDPSLLRRSMFPQNPRDKPDDTDTAVLESVLGRSFLALLRERKSGPADDRNATLVLFALQASIVHCIVDAFHDFCAGFSLTENAALTRIYEQMCQGESHVVSARWRALTHAYARATIPNYENSVRHRILSTLTKRFAAVHSLLRGKAETGSVLRDEFSAELAQISEIALRLSLMVKEQITSAKYEVYVPAPDQDFDTDFMEDAFNEHTGTTNVHQMFCTVEMGLVEILHSQKGRMGAGESSGCQKVLLKAKTVSLDSVSSFLADHATSPYDSSWVTVLPSHGHGRN